VADPLHELREQVQRALELENDAAFVPHITLAKNIRDQATWAVINDARRQFNNVDFGKVTVANFELVRSGRISKHEVIQTYQALSF
jgi:2'-5' RNA ligase